MFAKILLDYAARAVEFYFGPVRGLSLDSHDDLAKRLVEYAKSKGLSALDEELKILVATLKTEVSDYRDYEIAHEKSPRSIKGTMFTLGEQPQARIMNAKVYPTERDLQRESRSLHEVAELLDVYIRKALDWIAANRGGCCLPVPNEQNGPKPN